MSAVRFKRHIFGVIVVQNTTNFMFPVTFRA